MQGGASFPKQMRRGDVQQHTEGGFAPARSSAAGQCCVCAEFKALQVRVRSVLGFYCMIEKHGRRNQHNNERSLNKRGRDANPLQELSRAVTHF